MLYCGDACRRAWYQQVFTVALMWLSIISVIISVVPRTSRQERENLSGSLHWQENGFEMSTGTGFCRVSVEISQSSCLSWQAALPGLLRALMECNHVFLFSLFLFLLSFFNIVFFVYNCLWCLKLLFIPLSENVQLYILFWIIGMFIFCFISFVWFKGSCESIKKTHIEHCWNSMSVLASPVQPLVLLMVLKKLLQRPAL